MPTHRSDRLSDEQVLESCRLAAQACLAAGIYPSKVNLRAAGARGGPYRIVWARETLIASGAIVVPEPIVRRRPLGPRHDLTKPPSPGNRVPQALQECIPQTTVVVKPYRAPRYDSPVLGEVLTGVKAWKRLVDWKRLWRRAKPDPHRVPGEVPC